MDYDQIFAAYYTLYRTQAATPPSTDDEYIIGIGLANEAVNRWSNYEGTYWRELFDTNLVDASGDTVLVLNQPDYAAPANMKEAGGFIKFKDASGNTMRNVPIIEPQEAQFRGDKSNYCYFTGDPNNGFVLHINGVIDDSVAGLFIDYVYYKKPSLFTGGSDLTEMSEPYFVVHRMLANRFRGSRNPYASDAKNDAEDILKTMQMDNNSGSWADPWRLADNSGAQFGADVYDRNRIF